MRGALPLLLIAGALDGGFALFVMTAQAFFPDTLGAGAGAPGFALGLYGATRVLLQLPGGVLARRIGARRLIALGMGGGALAVLLLAAAQGTAQAYALTVLYGAGTALAWPAVYLLAGDQTEDERGALLSLITFCALGGMGGGIVVGAALVDVVEVRALLVGIGVVLGVGVISVRALTPRPPLPMLGEGENAGIRLPAHGPALGTTPDSGTPSPSIGRGGRRVRARSQILRALVPALALQAVGLSMLLPLLRQYANDQLGLQVHDLILLGVPAGVLAVATFLPAGRLADRLGRAPVVAVGSAAAALGVLLLAEAGSGLLFTLGAVPLAVGYAASAPALGAWIADLTDDAGRNVGLALTVQGVALAIGPALTGLLIADAGPSLPMRIAALMWLGAALAAALPLRRAASHILVQSEEATP